MEGKIQLGVIVVIQERDNDGLDQDCGGKDGDKWIDLREI